MITALLLVVTVIVTNPRSLGGRTGLLRLQPRCQPFPGDPGPCSSVGPGSCLDAHGTLDAENTDLHTPTEREREMCVYVISTIYNIVKKAWMYMYIHMLRTRSKYQWNLELPQALNFGMCLKLYRDSNYG